ncbi:MAG: hypothetical protein BGO09_00495 [Bacteroidetes bacterium 47-18]|mgnify:CR=1 FL=1|nr:MAG: hypothetical protein BGO09_00495 [Bacteroidetes bacterium 47-18]
MKFGTKLKTLRTARNLDQDEMSRLLHVSQSVYSRYENDEKSVKADDAFVQRVAEEFGVSAKWLVNEDSNINITFEKDSIHTGATGMSGIGVIGQVENYYSVPKDFMDAFIKQQKMLEKLLEKLIKG